MKIELKITLSKEYCQALNKRALEKNIDINDVIKEAIACYAKALEKQN